MIELFVKRPAMTVMFVMVFVVLGIVSYSNLIIERTPKIDFPIVSIKTFYNGASPVEIETQIIKKIEDAIAEISQIKKINSIANENFGLTMIEFKIDADINIKLIEVKDKVEAIINDLPREADKPVISKFDPLIQPIVDLVLVSDTADERTLYEYADKKLRNKLSVIEGVASVDIYGGKHRQINVKLDHMLMQKYYISISDVIKAVDQLNVNVPGGSVEKDEHKSTFRLVGEFENVDELAHMVIVSGEGETLTLSDIGTVEDSFKKVETYSRYNGKHVVGLSLKKLSDGDAVAIIKKNKKRS
ncbi:MAG: efflux RND transporter permease subunit [bacterium]